MASLPQIEIPLYGIGVSPGIAIGPARMFHVTALDVPASSIEDPAAELARFDEAVKKARVTLTALKEQTLDELGEKHAAIFQAHIDLLDDVALRPEVERRLNEEKLSVEYLVNDLIGRYTKMLGQVQDPLFRERSNDLLDVGRRILGYLLEEELESLEHLEEPCVIVAHDLSPSEAVNMDLTNTMGLATDAGGPTSHMAIIARAFQIPTVVGLRYLGSRIGKGDTVIVDGTKGSVIIHPREETLERYRSEKQRQEELRLALAEAATEGPSVTLDGKEIPTYANIELLAETHLSKRAKCQGVGLYRTEFLFINRASLPTEEEQYEHYRRIVEAMAPLPVTVRTLDLGGDKALPSVTAERETNPQLGWRSIRLCLDRPDIFKSQLRALLRASVHGEMQIILPMITGIDQFLEAKQVVEEVKEDLRQRGVPFDEELKLGSMVETPAAALIADRLAQVCDFLSIGTNDLIQYCLAVDRANQRTAHLYQPTHLSVLRLLEKTLSAAKAADIPCGICGEMAGDPVLTELLLGIGFASLSMSSISLPRVRAEIANIHLATAKRFARKVLKMSSASEIRALVEERYESRGTLKHLQTAKA
ncbi:MAG: phosphoenolpyruvate--protein phosphotransferase [Candidatus Hydrogenedentes bacterium]|nr:phosphoenolpyruvate--protein phosphotransferase [Candidatus Hydrogenedentota bacterium]